MATTMRDYAANECLFPLDPADAAGADLDPIAAGLMDRIIASRGHRRLVDAYVVFRGPASLPGESGEVEDVQPVRFGPPRGRTAARLIADTAETLRTLARPGRVAGFR